MTPPPVAGSSKELTVRELLDTLSDELELKLLTGSAGLERRIDSARIQKLGLALTGYTDYLHPERVQFLGRTEINYLSRLATEAADQALARAVEVGICAIVMTHNLPAPGRLLVEAEKARVPVLLTSLPSSSAIAGVTAFLQERLAPSTSIHGVLLDVFGLGVLLLGDSGVGKSECALDLVLRGHRLVGDDLVVVRRMGQGLVGSGSREFPYLMEIRGLGILNIKDLFGVSAVRPSKPVDLVLRLARWDNTQDYDRLGVDESFETLIGISVPLATIPVAPGRNLATLVEVAVRLQLQKNQGYNPTRDLLDRLNRRLRPAPETTPPADEDPS